MISLAFDAAIFTAMDTADLRQVMRAALQTTSDAEMLEVLGVGRQEMPPRYALLTQMFGRTGVIPSTSSGVVRPISSSQCPPTRM